MALKVAGARISGAAAGGGAAGPSQRITEKALNGGQDFLELAGRVSRGLRWGGLLAFPADQVFQRDAQLVGDEFGGVVAFIFAGAGDGPVEACARVELVARVFEKAGDFLVNHGLGRRKGM